jgi:hypothetical protein
MVKDLKGISQFFLRELPSQTLPSQFKARAFKATRRRDGQFHGSLRPRVATCENLFADAQDVKLKAESLLCRLE